MKRLIALAMTGAVAAPLYAQSNIQIYGVADAYVQGGKYMGDSTVGVGTGGMKPNSLGFRGEEDLGSGLKAVFVLEEGYDISTGKTDGMNAADNAANGGTQAFTRQSYVGLKGNFGQVSLGRQYAEGYYIPDYDAMIGLALSPQRMLTTFSSMTIAPNLMARWNNSIAYKGTFQSVSFSAIYSAGNQETTTGDYTANGLGKSKYSNDDKYGVALKYNNGPLKIGVLYQAAKFKSSYNTTASQYVRSSDGLDRTQKEWFIGSSYNFGMATLAGSYQQANSINGIDNLDIKLWQVGVIVPVGVGNIHVAYASAKINDGNKFSNANVNGDRGSQKPEVIAFAYTHALSKRTVAYGGFAYADYDNLDWAQAGVLGMNTNGHVFKDASGVAHADQIDKTKLVFFGMHHQF